MKRLLLVAGGLAALVALGAWQYRRRFPPPEPPPPAAELQELQAKADALGERLRAALVAHGEKNLAQAPRAGVMIGVPVGFTSAIAEQVVTGLFRDMTLTLHNLKVHKEGEVRVKMVLKKKRIGVFVLDVLIHEVKGILRPGRPVLRFGDNRLGFDLPVSLAEGQGRASLRLRWDSKGLAANTVCGDVDVTKEVTGEVIPQDYRLTGGFRIAAEGDSVLLKPDFADLAVRIFIKPTDQAWKAVDEVMEGTRAGCEMALGKVDIKARLGEIVGRGFNVKVPKKLHKPIRLPAGIRQSLDVQGIRLAFQVTPTAVVLTEERLWYGADLALEKPAAPGGGGR